MRELELKFEVPTGAAASLRGELCRRGARTVRMRAFYFDTPDFALARNGLSLRLRREGRTWMQTLKGAGASAVERLEHNVALRERGDAMPQFDERRHMQAPAAAQLRAALASASVPRLAVRYSTDIQRLVCDLRVRDAVIEAAFDSGTIGAGKRTTPVCELELEHKKGDVRALFDLAKAWSGFGGLWLNTVSKAARGVRLARGDKFGPPVKAARPRVDGDMDGSQFVRAVLGSTLDQVLGNASEIAAGSADEEHVHQLRVGLRRTRTALRELAGLDVRIDSAWEEPLAKVFARLGEVRDRVTAARAARPLLEEAQAPKLEWNGDGSEVDLAATVRERPFQAVLLDMLGFALDDAPAAKPVPSLPKYLGRRLARLHRRVAAASRRFEQLPLDEQHRARKRLKRLRYLTEFCAPVFDAKAARRYLEHLEPAQDALGAHIDIVVALERFRDDARTDPRALFAVGFLEAHLRNTARDARAALKKVAKAQPFWGE